MLFSTIVGNPPFKKNLHLQIIESIIPYLKEEEGVGCFIHPARWLEDPLADLKKNSDKVRFKSIVDRLDDVKIMDIKTVNDKFGITMNSEVMISTMRSRPTGKDIKIYDKIAQDCIDVILPYSRKNNLGMHVEQDKIDGWRVETRALTGIDPHSNSMSEYNRKVISNLFGMNKVNVFHNGYYGKIEWMKTRKQTKGQKSSGAPLPHSIKFKTRTEAVNFEKSCNTNFYNNILYLLKIDMHTPLNYLPWMGDYSHAWTDEDYCRFFGKIGMSEECQRWMCRDVYDYRIKDFINYDTVAKRTENYTSAA